MSLHTYRVVEGKHWRPAPEGSDERMVCYVPGDLIQLTREAAKSLGDGSLEGKGGLKTIKRKYVEYLMPVEAPAPAPQPVSPPEPAPVATAEPALAEPSESEDVGDWLSGSWQAVKARVAELGDPAEVQAVLEAEEAGKARQSVLDACRVRLAELSG